MQVKKIMNESDRYRPKSVDQCAKDKTWFYPHTWSGWTSSRKIKPLPYHFILFTTFIHAILPRNKPNCRSIQFFDFYKHCLRKMLLYLYEQLKKGWYSLSSSITYVLLMSPSSHLLEQSFLNVNVYTNHSEIVKRHIPTLEVCLGWGLRFCIFAARPQIIWRNHSDLVIIYNSVRISEMQGSIPKKKLQTKAWWFRRAFKSEGPVSKW